MLYLFRSSLIHQYFKCKFVVFYNTFVSWVCHCQSTSLYLKLCLIIIFCRFGKTVGHGLDVWIIQWSNCLVWISWMYCNKMQLMKTTVLKSFTSMWIGKLVSRFTLSNLIKRLKIKILCPKPPAPALCKMSLFGSNNT